MRLVFRLVALLLIAAIGLAASFVWWTQQPIEVSENALEFRVMPGSSLRAAVRQMNEAGLSVDADLFVLLARWQGKSGAIKPGTYGTSVGETPLSLLEKLASGKVIQASITLVEGWTFRQFRARLDAHPALRHDTLGMSEAQIIARLGLPLSSLEGRLFPDTYLFDKESSDLELIARAVASMQARLDETWSQRPAGLPYKTADDVLTMASIIEKETGREEDRAHVAAVFVNRLRIGMRLQTDPTVIYGLGEAFDGNLRKIHLQTDTPYNTYTRAGLPPTPIAMPGLASLRAAISPADSTAIYFVARGDGTSQFSRTLDEHNRAVNRYQRGGK
ncbi:endolytic transglycosylase MltG [uncultured Azonexus sp.]|uniref:endolytic transglycosylase MltG n=1 Tax=uncultured Azonexus sp. TaxID=520307 RepID=UPI0026366743|nr:endolytic transglycosylase MltG [uncultured Azonexus sp.]